LPHASRIVRPSDSVNWSKEKAISLSELKEEEEDSSWSFF
jgi:hypothetical protein